MRFLHTADWHIGKRLQGFSLQEDQQVAFDQLVALAHQEQVDAIVMAGDVYDRALANEETVAQVNQMLTTLNRKSGLPVLMISGNHDSAVRLSTGRQWFAATDFYLNTQLQEAFTPVVLGDTQFFLLPYFEPLAARQYFEDDGIKTVQQALPKIVAAMQARFDPAKRHVLVAHFFAAGASRSESETLVSVGGLDAVPVDALAAFDYVALGHLHNRNALHAPNVQYSGALLQYAVSEVGQEKGVYLVDTADMTRRFIALPPKRPLVHLTDSFANLMAAEGISEAVRQTYVAVTLTDTQVIPNVMSQLRSVFPLIINLNRAQPLEVKTLAQASVTKQAPMSVLAQFYAGITQTEMSDSQREWAEAALTQLEQGDQS